MQPILGPLAATGVAVLSAGIIAITPVAQPLSDSVAPAVQLTADTDWSVILDKAGQGASGLTDSYFEAPLPISQQIIANQISYLGELPDIATIAQQMTTNIARATEAPFAPTTDTLSEQHEFLYDALPLIQQVPLVDLFFEISPTGEALLDFATTHASGVLFGLVGTVAGPVLVLGSSLQSIVDDLTAASPDLARALAALLKTPAEMADAFLNGGVHLDVTALAEELGPSIGATIPEGTKVGIAFGGLLSPGGSVFNALELDYDRDVLGLPMIRFNLATGQGPGPIGSLIEMNKAIAKAIGWDGAGSPLAPSDDSSETDTAAQVDEVPSSRALTSLTRDPETTDQPADSTADDATSDRESRQDKRTGDNEIGDGDEAETREPMSTDVEASPADADKVNDAEGMDKAETDKPDEAAAKSDDDGDDNDGATERRVGRQSVVATGR